MIRSIHIKNVQSHRDTYIEFDKGVNAIVGITGSGKTAIFRAFKWVAFNRPMGDNYLSHDAEEMSVTITLDNDVKVERGRDKKGNYYKLDKQEFRAFKQEVPPEIQQALNISDINLQFQMDSPFLLSNKSGEVAQMLNKIVNLDVIDRAISNVHKKKLETDRDLRYTENQITQLTTQLESFSYLEKMEVDLSVFEQLYQSRIKTTNQIRNLNNLIGQIEKAQDGIKKYSRILRAESMLKRTLALVDKKRYIEEEITGLTRIMNDIRRKENEIAKYRKEVNHLEKEFHQLMPQKCPLCGK